MNEEMTNGHVQMLPQDSLEFKLMLAYTRKRRPGDPRLLQDNNATDMSMNTTPIESSTEVCIKKKKKKSKIRRVSRLLSCIRPQRHEHVQYRDEPVQQARIRVEFIMEDGTEKMADSLTQISDSVNFYSEFETDGEDDVVQKLVELLRKHGDDLDSKIKADKVLSEKLQSCLSYGFFSRVMTTFCRRVTPDVPPQESQDSVQVALICEATSRLFSADHHPMNRVLGFGATFLHENFPTWSRSITGFSNQQVTHFPDNEKDEEDEEVH